MVVKGMTVYVAVDLPDDGLHKGDKGIVQEVSVVPGLPLVLVSFSSGLIDCWEHHLTTVDPQIERLQ